MTTQTAIERLERAVEYVESAENRMHPYVQAGNTTGADARAALEDVEALVTAAERVRYLTDEGEEQMKTAAWTIAWNDAAAALHTALDKFTVKS